ncbi:hypothetical protein J4558_05425 [Leptolyngbya sp. 15MV]|nr:hypothetical protein J4558_05425 [Leptolyngbya sp. 15MV]
MGWIKDRLRDAERTARDERKRVQDKIDEETKRLRDQAKANLERARNDTRHVTGVDLKPIIKSIVGPIHIVTKLAEGDNLTEATTDLVINQVGASGEIFGLFGDDAEKLAESIALISAIPVLVVVNLAGDAVEVAEGDIEPEDLVGSPLSTLLQHAHQLYSPVARPMPIELKYLLNGIVPAQILNRAKYVIDKTPDNVAGLANLLNHLSDDGIHAVTADDIVIFSSGPSSSLSGLLLWVHELYHVGQYAEWGLEKFAAEYTTNYKDVEEAANVAEEKALPILSERLAGLT